MIDLAERARQGHVSRGLYITIPEPQILEMVKSAGYDFARLDGEHVNFSAGTLENMFRTARLLDFPLQIRLGSMENLDALLALEPHGGYDAGNWKERGGSLCTEDEVPASGPQGNVRIFRPDPVRRPFQKRIYGGG